MVGCRTDLEFLIDIRSSVCCHRHARAYSLLEVNSDGRAGDVRFRSIQTPTPTGGGHVGGMVAQGLSKDCIFDMDFRYVFKSAVGAVVYKLR